MGAFYRALIPSVIAAAPDRDALAESLVALHELFDRRLEVFLRAQEDEIVRRLAEEQDQAAQAAEKARELARANEALRRSEAESQHRAEQIGLLGSVAHRIAAILDPERLMQEAAETIQARMNHTYVAVVVLDDEGVLVGRWAGRSGVGRRSAGRAQGPAGGIIGRALRKKAPQVVADVSRDPDYHADVPGTHAEMVIPLLDGGEAIGAIDFQTEQPRAFDLDDVAVGETIAEFLVVALRNARLFSEARRQHGLARAGKAADRRAAQGRLRGLDHRALLPALPHDGDPGPHLPGRARASRRCSSTPGTPTSRSATAWRSRRRTGRSSCSSTCGSGTWRRETATMGSTSSTPWTSLDLAADVGSGLLRDGPPAAMFHASGRQLRRRRGERELRRDGGRRRVRAGGGRRRGEAARSSWCSWWPRPSSPLAPRVST